jgi:3beta-hydroxy-delta5-steroid dehydrogenase/steroid delta-isomerase
MAAAPQNTDAGIRPIPTAELKHCLVTGGAGFAGSHLAQALLAKGCKVRILDIKDPDFSDPNMESVKGDLSNLSLLDSVCEGVDTVFHMAAVIDLMGGRGVSKAYRERSDSVNIQGTKNVHKACQNQGVKRLVYTSSYNACNNGHPIFCARSDQPYATRIFDEYTRTKSVSEPWLLQQSDPDGVLTCALRPPGIWGSGSNVQIDTFVDMLVDGKFVMTMGSPQAVMDNSHADNVAHAEILAAEHLVPGSPVCGKGYFISDDDPTNLYLWFKPLCEGLGYKYPKHSVPAWLVRPFMVIWEYLHFKLGLPKPLLSPIQLDIATNTYFASMEDARHDFGYEPIVSTKDGMKACIDYCKERLPSVIEQRKGKKK